MAALPSLLASCLLLLLGMASVVPALVFGVTFANFRRELPRELPVLGSRFPSVRGRRSERLRNGGNGRSVRPFTLWPTYDDGRPHFAPSTRKELHMGLFTKDIETLDDLFVHGLQTIYYAENQITEALPKMIDKATSPELRQGFETHLRETEGQIRRLERVFQMHGREAEQANCPAIDGIIKAGDSLSGNIADKNVLDAGLTAAAQLVEHYEIAQYGTLIAWARQLGRDDCAGVLEETLAEEKATDEKLSRLAEAKVNRRAETQTA